MVLISALSPNFLAIAAIPGKFLSGMFLGQHKHQGDLFFFFFGSGVNYFFSPVYAASCFCICSIKTKKRIHNKKKKKKSYIFERILY